MAPESPKNVVETETSHEKDVVHLRMYDALGRLSGVHLNTSNACSEATDHSWSESPRYLRPTAS